MKRNVFFAIAGLLLAVIFSGCITPVGITGSTTPLQDREFRRLGRAEGKAMTWSLLGVWSMGKPDIDGAIGLAVRKKEGDALVDVRWYERTYYFILFSLHELVVTGEVIKFVPDFTKTGSQLK